MKQTLKKKLLKWATGLGVVLLPALALAQQAAETAEKGKGLSGQQLAFYIVGALCVAGAVATIMSRNPVMAAMSLVGTLCASAVVYLLLHASFMAAMQVLVYAGAIMVLFVFVVMSVERPDEQEEPLGGNLINLVVGVAAIALLFWRLFPILMGPEVKLAAATVGEDYGTVTGIGRFLFSDYLFPFEAISILLLVAIVGAVVVNRRRATAEEKGGQA